MIDYKKEYRKLKKENHELYNTISKLNSDNSRLKGWIEYKFNWFIDLVYENKQPCLKYLIKNSKDILVKVQ